MSGEDFELSQELTIGSVDGGTLPAMPPEPKSLSNWDSMVMEVFRGKMF